MAAPDSLSAMKRSPLRSRRFLAVAAMEFWERFAMYGVKSLLALILIDHVLAGNLSHVAGAAMVRELSASLFGPVSTTGLASQLYGYANALIYLSIPLGGLFGDLLDNRRVMVLFGGIAMLAGLGMMLQESSFLIGLIPFAAGTGLMKGNLSVQIGLLFSDEAERQRGYTIYLGFLNAGAIGGPLICGAVALYAGPMAAIGVAALAVLIGLVLYGRYGERDQAGRIVSTPGTTVRAAPVINTALLIAALGAVYLCFAAYEQIGNIFLVWARRHVDLDLHGWRMPVAWFLSLDGLATLTLIAGWQALLRMFDRRGVAIEPLVQIMVGTILCAAGYLVLTIASALDGATHIGWALAYLLLVDAAIVLVWPSGLSLIAGLAPRNMVGWWTGLFYLHGFFANICVGLIGVYYDRMPTPAFWLFHAMMATFGGFVALGAGVLLVPALRSRQATTTSA
ncbi:POT family proton-dependent oligopeptide transporter [Stakelama pacifica]|uniref:POT family proton-dependent oligopeptide transporter n=2 Tax=Stakelama pacifica TaxID=517720 RepID=A0A4V3BUL4_9SPHN|nr:POT family proton-dependent oligopeptide transporter [Stakelama pacifica]GGO91326.1 MFS transporter [Stakelama pacifica]